MSSEAERPEGAFEDRYFEVADGLQLHYRDYPGPADKPPLLCLHGLTRNARDWGGFAERYSPSHRVLALEFRGRGGSDHDPVPSRYVPITYARDVIEMLDKLMPKSQIVLAQKPERKRSWWQDMGRRLRGTWRPDPTRGLR